MSRRQEADSDPGFSGGRQRPQAAGDAGLVAGFNCSAVRGVACAEGGVETVTMYRMYKCRGRQDAGSDLSLSHMCPSVVLAGAFSMNGK